MKIQIKNKPIDFYKLLDETGFANLKSLEFWNMRITLINILNINKKSETPFNDIIEKLTMLKNLKKL